MSKKLRLLLCIVSLVVFAVSTAFLVQYFFHRQQNQRSQALALEIALGSGNGNIPEVTAPQLSQESPGQIGPVWVPVPFQGDPEHMALLGSIDLAALRQVNPHVIGWIYVPGTGIHFPLVQGEDNSYYLEHSWDGRSNVLGSIFLEARNDPALTDHNTIIYGHNITGGQMFAPLHRFANEDYSRSHPYIYLLTDGGIFRYEIFASYLADVDSPTYGLSFNQASTREALLTYALEHSQIHTGIVPSSTDRILTLSTCTGQGYEQRRVVMARMEMMQVQ